MSAPLKTAVRSAMLRLLLPLARLLLKVGVGAGELQRLVHEAYVRAAQGALLGQRYDSKTGVFEAIVDIDPATLNIDPKEIENTAGPSTVVGSLAVGLLLAPPPETVAELVMELVPTGALLLTFTVIVNGCEVPFGLMTGL